MPTSTWWTTTLMFVTSLLHEECVAELLRLGADARRVTNDGWAALHRVAAYADRGRDGGGVVRLLVAGGWGAAVHNNNGRTAVEVARDFHGAEWATVIEGWVVAAMA